MSQCRLSGLAQSLSSSSSLYLRYSSSDIKASLSGRMRKGMKSRGKAEKSLGEFFFVALHRERFCPSQRNRLLAKARRRDKINLFTFYSGSINNNYGAKERRAGKSGTERRGITARH
jgi:hypothetical protein